MVVVDRFSKMAYFMSCHRIDNASHITYLYFKEAIKIQGVPRSIVCDRTPNSYLIRAGAYENY